MSSSFVNTLADYSKVVGGGGGGDLTHRLSAANMLPIHPVGSLSSNPSPGFGVLAWESRWKAKLLPCMFDGTGWGCTRTLHFLTRTVLYEHLLPY